MISSRGKRTELSFGISRAFTLILIIRRSIPGGVDIYTLEEPTPLEESKFHVHPIEKLLCSREGVSRFILASRRKRTGQSLIVRHFIAYHFIA